MSSPPKFRATISVVIAITSYLPFFFLALGLGVLAFAEGKQADKALGERIAKGVVLEGRLWLQGTMISSKDPTGGLVSLGLVDGSRQTHFNRGVLGIEVSGSELWVVRSLSLTERKFAISVLRKGVFEDVTKFIVPAKDDPIALLDNNGKPVMLSTRAVRTFSGSGGGVDLVNLNAELGSGVQVSAAIPKGGGDVYVGFNVGEWGGGLQSVDLRTGKVTKIERRDRKELCAGPLNAECDPVTSVIPDSQNRDCVLASVGLVHLGRSEGRILRVCGRDVTVVSEKLVDEKGADKWKMTEAFYGLEPAKNGGFWGITYRALYRFTPAGALEKEYPLPKMKSESGVYLSRDLPGVIVVRTDVNWAVSTSGYTPLVISSER